MLIPAAKKTGTPITSVKNGTIKNPPPTPKIDDITAIKNPAANTVYVSGEDFITALKEAGAVAYEGINPDVSAFDEIIEKCIN